MSERNRKRKKNREKESWQREKKLASVKCNKFSVNSETISQLEAPKMI